MSNKILRALLKNDRVTGDNKKRRRQQFPFVLSVSAQRWSRRMIENCCRLRFLFASKAGGSNKIRSSFDSSAARLRSGRTDFIASACFFALKFIHLSFKRTILIIATLLLLNQSAVFANEEDLAALEERIKELTNENELLRHELAEAKANQNSGDSSSSNNSDEKPPKQNPKNDLNAGTGPMAREDFDNAIAVMQTGNLDKAEKQWKNFLKYHSDSKLKPKAEIRLAEVYEAGEKYAEAVEIYAKYAENKEPKIIIKLASNLQKMGKTGDAAIILKQLNPKMVPSNLQGAYKDLKKELKV